MKRIEYLAGLFDGEGCVLIAKTSSLSANGRKCCTYKCRAKIALKESDSFILEEFRVRWGGNISKSSPGTNQPCFAWYAVGDDLVAFLTEIVPHLVLKQQQAKLVLEFCVKFRRNVSGLKWSRSSFGFPPEIETARESIFNQVKSLKRVGNVERFQ